MGQRQITGVVLSATFILSVISGYPLQERDLERKDCLVCTMWCEYGFVPGPNGCPLCKCQEPPSDILLKLARGKSCQEPECFYECESGYLANQYGCLSCVCKSQEEDIIRQQLLHQHLNDAGGLPL